MGLKRDIGMIGASMLVLNGLIGAGIFALPARMADALGDFSPYVFLMFGALMLTIVWCFASLSSHFSQTGGPVLYAQQAFGNAVGFQTGWLFYLARATAIAANAHVLFLYASYLFPEVTQGYQDDVLIIVICLILTLVNLIGVKRSVGFLDGLTVLKLTPLFGLVGYGLLTADVDPTITEVPQLDALGAGAILTLYALIGFETAVVTTGETEKPKHTLPIALMATVIATSILYFIVQLAYINVMETWVVDGTPMIAFAQTLAGEWGALIMALAAVFSIAANLLANMISTSRLTFAMAQEGSLPGWFGHVSARFSTPDNSIITLGVFACVLSLTGGFVWLAVVSVLARLTVYAVCILALMRLRKERQWSAPRNTFMHLMWRIVPWIALLVCIGAASQSSAQAILMLVALLVAGILLYWLNKRFTSVSHQE